jgi:DNA repair protein RecN (Recombination protein N)
MGDEAHPVWQDPERMLAYGVVIIGSCMLNYLSIRNLALIDQVELEFQAGFTALTGETGAGKSILLDGLQLALGSRADSDQVRENSDKTEIVACFDASRANVGGWLSEHELKSGEELMLRRVVTADGRSRAWINSTPVPIQTLRELGQQLVEFHGQNAHQVLHKPAHQLALLDCFAGNQDQLAELATTYLKWRDTRSELNSLRAETALSPAERELLEFQVEELARDALGADQLETLEQQHRTLAHAGELMAAAATAAGLIDGEGDPATALVARAVREINEALRFDPSLANVREILDSVLIQLQEAAGELSRLEDRVELDPERLSQVDQQLANIHQLARKHRIESTDLMARLDELRNRLERASASDEQEQQLCQQLDQLDQQYATGARKLSESRHKAASEFADSVTRAMGELGMAQGRMEVGVDFQADRPPGLNGRDEVQYRITTNPGNPPKPLSRVASGGELSRICLAIKVVVAELDNRASMIFDEVDAGVGGAIAEIVGMKLRTVSQDRQVLSVTHLPQVASCAHQQMRISKSSEDGRTVTEVEPLNEQRRIEEIARMLGGVEVTDRATEHAREMIAAGRAGNAD